MTNPDLVTRLVVGESITVPLGVPVGASGADDREAPVKLVNGVWALRSKAAENGTVSAFGQALLSRCVLAVPRRGKVVGVLAMITLVAALGLGWCWRTLQHQQTNTSAEAKSSTPAQTASPALPIAPAANEVAGPALALVNAPNTPETTLRDSEAPPAALATASTSGGAAVPGPAGAAKPSPSVQNPPPPLPLASPAARTPTAVSDKSVALSEPQPVKPVGTKEPIPTAAAKKDQDGRTVPSAVVLDEAPAGAKGAPAKAAVAASVEKAATSATPTVASKPQSLPRGAGLVAITPDGKVAVFTNPKTRLPEQFKVGDQLQGGDVIRSIDLKQGKVLTSAKEYTLD